VVRLKGMGHAKTERAQKKYGNIEFDENDLAQSIIQERNAGRILWRVGNCPMTI